MPVGSDGIPPLTLPVSLVHRNQLASSGEIYIVKQTSWCIVILLTTYAYLPIYYIDIE